MIALRHGFIVTATIALVLIGGLIARVIYEEIESHFFKDQEGG